MRKNTPDSVNSSLIRNGNKITNCIGCGKEYSINEFDTTCSFCTSILRKASANDHTALGILKVLACEMHRLGRPKESWEMWEWLIEKGYTGQKLVDYYLAIHEEEIIKQFDKRERR